MPTRKFSLVHDMQPNRLFPNRLPTKIPRDWPIMLDMLRRMWEVGTDTILVTAFVHYLDDHPDPLGRKLLL